MSNLLSGSEKMRKSWVSVGLLVTSIYNSSLMAAEATSFTEEQMRTCLEQSILTADKFMTVRQLEEACAILLNQSSSSATETGSASSQTDAAGKSNSPAVEAPPSRMLKDRG